MALYSTALWHLRKEVELAALSQELLAVDRLSAQAWLVAGNCYSLQQEHEQALAAFKRALQVGVRPGAGHAPPSGALWCAVADGWWLMPKRLPLQACPPPSLPAQVNCMCACACGVHAHQLRIPSHQAQRGLPAGAPCTQRPGTDTRASPAVQVDPTCVYAHTLCGHEYLAAEDLDSAAAAYKWVHMAAAQHLVLRMVELLCIVLPACEAVGAALAVRACAWHQGTRVPALAVLPGAPSTSHCTSQRSALPPN